MTHNLWYVHDLHGMGHIIKKYLALTFSKFELHLWQAVNLWICFWRFCVSFERSSISISRAFMISWFTLISLWLGFEHIFYFILMVTSKFALQRGNMKCVKKHVKKNFHTWWHLHFYFKYPKIVEFHFRLFFRFKIDHVFLFEIIDFCSARNIWNAHFSFSESDGKNGAFKIFWVWKWVWKWCISSKNYVINFKRKITGNESLRF